MPRQPRLDAPGILHHVMVRGFERRTVFRDDADRTDFVARLAAVAEQGAWTVSPGALVPNYAHLTLRKGLQSLRKVMRRVLTGYGIVYDRGHLM